MNVKTHRIRRVLMCAAGLMLTTTVASVASGQTCRDNPGTNSHVLVPVFKSPQPLIGMYVADSLRLKIARLDCKNWYPVPKAYLEDVLTSSGYPTNVALAATDVRQLAINTSSEAVVLGYATGDASRGDNIRSWTVYFQVVSPRDPKLIQPLDTFTNAKLNNVLDAAWRQSLKPALSAMPSIKRCEGFAGDIQRAGPDQAKAKMAADSAIVAAKQALTTYETSTMARICLASVYQLVDYPPDSVLRLTAEVLAVNPDDYWATSLSQGAERDKGNVDLANELLVKLLALDPTNVKLQEDVIRELAASGKMDDARRVLAEAKALHEGQPGIVELEAAICFAVFDWACSHKAYERLATVDSSRVDTTYFKRIVTAYRSDSNKTAAANAATRGITKFPEAMPLHLLRIQMFREAGDTSASLDAARQALALDASRFDIYPQIADIYRSRGQLDSLMITLRTAVRHATTEQDSVMVADFALSPAKGLFEAANLDSLKDLDKYQKIIDIVSFSDSVKTSDPGHFYLGASYFTIAQTAIIRSAEIKDCEMAKRGKDALLKTEQYLPAMGRASREYALAIASSQTELRIYANEVIAAICASGG